DTCGACLLNSYSDVSGSTTCTACSGGRKTHTTGSSSAEQCLLNCEQGSGSDGTTCTPCTAGTYSDAFDSSPCQLCPANTFSTATAATDASTC
ncbi:hypothetical protein T484DRAFT_1590761, partial [Baffinella frigidus]